MSEGYLPIFPFILPTPTSLRPAEWVGRAAYPPVFLTLSQGLSARVSIPSQPELSLVPYWSWLRDRCRGHPSIELAVWAHSSSAGVSVGVIVNERWAVRLILHTPDSPSAPPRHMEDWACLWAITFFLSASLSLPENRRPRVYTTASRYGAGPERHMGASVRRITDRFPAGLEWIACLPGGWGGAGRLACGVARWGGAGFPLNINTALTVNVTLDREGVLGALSPDDPDLRADIIEAQRNDLLVVPSGRLPTSCGCTAYSIPCSVSSGDSDTLHISVAVLRSQNDLPCVGVVVGPSFTWHLTINRDEMASRGSDADRAAWMYCFILMVIQTEMRGTVAVCLRHHPSSDRLNAPHLGFTHALLRMQEGPNGFSFRPCPGGCGAGCDHAAGRLDRLQTVRGWAPADNHCDYSWEVGGWEATCDYPGESRAPPSILSPHIPRATSTLGLGREALLHYVDRLCSAYCLWFVPGQMVGRGVYTILSPRRDHRAINDILPVARAPCFEALAGPGPNLVRLNVSFPGGRLGCPNALHSRTTSPFFRSSGR